MILLGKKNLKYPLFKRGMSANADREIFRLISFHEISNYLLYEREDIKFLQTKS